MTGFVDNVLQVIYGYKKILKRHLPLNQYINKIRKLGINRMQLRNLGETSLFQLVDTILKDLENYKCEPESSTGLYSGVHEFIAHCKENLRHYRLENSRVVHAAQEASHAIVEVVQIVALSGGAKRAVLTEKLKPCVDKILQYATPEQINMLIDNLNKQKVDKNHPSHLVLRMLGVERSKIHESTS